MNSLGSGFTCSCGTTTVVYHIDDVRVEKGTFDRINAAAKGLLRIAKVEHNYNYVHLFFVTF